MESELILKKRDLRWRLLRRLYEFEQTASRKGVAPVVLIRLNDLKDLAACNESERSIFLYWYRKGYTTGEAEFKVVGYRQEDVDYFTRVWLTQKGLEYVEDRIVDESEEPKIKQTASSKLKKPQISVVGKLIDEKFNGDELRDLARRLSVDYENLSGDNKLRKAQELVEYCVRHEKISELFSILREERPRFDWSEALI